MEEILTGWKEISGYLKVTEKTAIKYHKKNGLPITKDPAGHPVIRKSSVEKWRLQERIS